MGKSQLVNLVRSEAFRLPPMPSGLDICDLLTFEVGKTVFVLVTTLCQDRTQTGLTQLFRLQSGTQRLEPVLQLDLYHPRNLALGPESKGGRWIWIADHGLDAPPFPGGRSHLYWISEHGSVEVKEDPLLQVLAFSFDGCIWTNPKNQDTYLYQSNIGNSAPRLLRWKDKHSPLEELSHQLPKNLTSRKDRFLVSRLIDLDNEAAYIFLGGDYSCTTQEPMEQDAVLKVPFNGPTELKMKASPPRLKTKTWSTVEAIPFVQKSGKKPSLLALTHDFGFKEGFAEVLHQKNHLQWERNQHPLPLPCLAGKNTWISRAAIGDWDNDGRIDIILYLRGSVGGLPESQNNLVLLRQQKNGAYDLVECTATGFSTHFVGGFFIGRELFQLRYDGVFEKTSFVDT